MKFLKNLIALIRRNKYKELAERIQNLESRIFKKKELTPGNILDRYYSSVLFQMAWGEPETLEKEIDILQDKVDAICKHFKVHLEKTNAIESKWIVKKEK